jgi:hypothetical protein
MFRLILSGVISLSFLGLPLQAQELTYSYLLKRTHTLNHFLVAPADDESSDRLTFSVKEGRFSYVIQGPAVINRLYFDTNDGDIMLDFENSQLRLSIDGLDREIGEPLFVDYEQAGSLCLPLSVSETATLNIEGVGLSKVEMDIWYPSQKVLSDTNNECLTLHAKEIKAANSILKNNFHPPSRVNPVPKKIGASYFRGPDMPPSDTNGEFRWLIRGSGVVEYFDLQFIHKVAPADVETMLRSLVLRIEHNVENLEGDGLVVAEVPLGDFFTSYRHAIPSMHRYLGFDVRDQSFYCHLPIPFRNGLRFSVASDLVAPARFQMHAGLTRIPPEGIPPLTLRSNFFRAKDKSVAINAGLETSGPSRLIGSMFSFTSSSVLPLQSGEGYSFIDTNVRPSQTLGESVLRREGPGSFGNNSFVRWFQSSGPLGVDGFKYYPRLPIPADLETDYSLTTWWYGTIESQAEPFKRYSASERQHAPNPTPNFFIVENGIEAEHLSNIKMSPNSTISSSYAQPGNRVSSLVYSLWKPSKSNDGLFYTFEIEKSGRYELEVQLVRDQGMGAVQVLLNGVAVGEVIDCADNRFGVTGLISFGEQRMMARNNHTIGFRSVNGDPIGIDCFRIMPPKKIND